MPLSNEVRSGLSTGSRAFQEPAAPTPLPRFRAGEPPATIIDGKRFERSQLPRLSFPQDLSRFHFMIIENDWAGTLDNAGRSLIPRALIDLPFPTPLQDTFRVNYDANFNYLSYAGNLTDGLGRIPQAFLGASVNKFKTVTLENPDFRAFEFNWKLSPKNFQESQMIQRIAYRLRKGMTPSLKGVAGEDSIFVYPQIYTLAFLPNTRYMYKFKPCVLQALTVDYAGGQPVPSFYRPQGAESDAPPESLHVKTRWLEVEYWVKRDYKGDDLPTNNPYDVINYYDIVHEAPPESSSSFPPTASPDESGDTGPGGSAR